VWITSSLKTALTPTALALGNFDGVHRGHQQVIDAVTQVPGCRSTVLTFSPHPKEFFTGQPRKLLTPTQEKVLQLKQLGVEQLMLLPFNWELASLSPKEFVEQILIGGLQATHISVGADFCFGRQRTGTAQDLQAIAARHGVEVMIAGLEKQSGDRISSSAIRQALQQGDLATANNLLGRPYSLMGEVVVGQQLGRTLGFPTANLRLPDNKFLPHTGVYAVRVEIYTPAIDDVQPSLQSAIGVMNLGYRPTLNGTTQVPEVHLFDWEGNLYGKTLIVQLEKFLRPEQKFSSLNDLKVQIQADCAAARSLLSRLSSV
jgi:riboflavin kinase/FMN adenylyltransferase